MSNPPDHNAHHADAAARTLRHRLELQDVDLVGADRHLRFRPGLNIIQGHISTGKTTLVRLIRALLGTVPSDLPPEVDYVQAINADVLLGARAWGIYRPRTTTASAPVDIAERDAAGGQEPVSLRLAATGMANSYSRFMLNALSLPVVSVPEARSQPTDKQVAVSMTDWLGYCIVTGDELDTQVFGHRHTFRELKRRWIFELIYGYYDAVMARLTANLRATELKISALDRDAVVREKFLAGTPFADSEVLEERLDAARARLAALRSSNAEPTAEAEEIPGVRELRQTLLAARARQADLSDQSARINGQLSDLTDLHKQLSSQSARLTRAIVADEWLVDYDFIVCPRCGNDVDPGRAPDHHCYLCLQPARPAPSRDSLLIEQDRITSQLHETAEVLEARRRDLERLHKQSSEVDRTIASLSEQLNAQTESYVSDRATRIQQRAAAVASTEAEITRLTEYLTLLRRHEDLDQERARLLEEGEEIRSQIADHEQSRLEAEANVQALEARMLEYLRELHIPDLGQTLSVAINRTTYMPIVSGRTFDELSSQGLKTLVNVAHALAHHTVAIDRSLPLPGLLILDGLSANTGSEGFDQARVNDIYRLMRHVASDYRDTLQLVAVDNELPPAMTIELADYVVLTLTQDNRLIRIPSNAASE